MKKQILTLIIGILIGAIITTAVFLILKGNTNNRGNIEEMLSMGGSFTNRDKGFSMSGESSNQITEEDSNNIEE